MNVSYLSQSAWQQQNKSQLHANTEDEAVKHSNNFAGGHMYRSVDKVKYTHEVVWKDKKY
jgi:hypothetical protein